MPNPTTEFVEIELQTEEDACTRAVRQPGHEGAPPQWVAHRRTRWVVAQRCEVVLVVAAPEQWMEWAGWAAAGDAVAPADAGPPVVALSWLDAAVPSAAAAVQQTAVAYLMAALPALWLAQLRGLELVGQPAGDLLPAQPLAVRLAVVQNLDGR